METLDREDFVVYKPKIESKNFLPSWFSKKSENALSGCGIIPKTFLPLLHIPAILFIEPLGLASSFISPAGDA